MSYSASESAFISEVQAAWASGSKSELTASLTSASAENLAALRDLFCESTGIAIVMDSDLETREGRTNFRRGFMSAFDSRKPETGTAFRSASRAASERLSTPVTPPVRASGKTKVPHPTPEAELRAKINELRANVNDSSDFKRLMQAVETLSTEVDGIGAHLGELENRVADLDTRPTPAAAAGSAVDLAESFKELAAALRGNSGKPKDEKAEVSNKFVVYDVTTWGHTR